MPEPADSVPDFELHDVSRVFGRGEGLVRAVDGVSLQVLPGQRVGIVGESGSGKSTLVRMMAGLLAPTSGTIAFQGRSITGLRERDLDFLRAKVAMVFQDPRSSLDPRMRVGRIITEPLRSPLLKGKPGVPADAAGRKERRAEIMAKVGLDPASANRYPHEFSGGQRQRIAIARALAPRPRVLIADEATSALDVSVRAHVLNIIVDRVHDDGLTLIFVSHDLAVVRHVCDVVFVMQAGRIVESGTVEQVYEAPQVAYTRELVASIPHIRSVA
jgi:ABC-type glutathione transport system ATPase component